MTDSKKSRFGGKRKHNPLTEDARWCLSNEWEVKFSYFSQTNSHEKWKKLGCVRSMNFSKQGSVGFRTNLVVLKISTGSDTSAPPYVFQVSKLDLTQLSSSLDEKTRNKIDGAIEKKELAKVARMIYH